MPLFEITPDALIPLPETRFADVAVRERQDLQRLIKDQVQVLGETVTGEPELLILAEEFAEWEDSRRRIDLLAIDRAANLVVVELKRTDDGGHMELQALRYAAMVSALTFDKAQDLLQRYLKREGREGDAEQLILDFLGWPEPDKDDFAQDVRIILASADFSKELTTAVMWLNERDLDITCIRLKPYRHDERILLNVEQVIPLPEAAEYQVRLREKAREERRARGTSMDQQALYSFWSGLQAYVQEAALECPVPKPGTRHWLTVPLELPSMRVTTSWSLRESTAHIYVLLNDPLEQRRQLQAIVDDIQRATGASPTFGKGREGGGDYMHFQRETGGDPAQAYPWMVRVLSGLASFDWSEQVGH